MYCVLCIVYCVLCIVYSVLCIVYCVLCIVYYVLCIVLPDEDCQRVVKTLKSVSVDWCKSTTTPMLLNFTVHT